MRSAIFSNGSDAYQVEKIVYAGPVAKIPEDRRRNGSTHSFKIITVLGTVYSYYKDEELARKSRGMLGAMLDEIKPHAFRYGIEFLDPSRVVSFSKVVQFKKPMEEYTHGFVITIETAQEKSRELWFRYKSEDHAQKGRKALWASIHAVNGMSKPPEQPKVEVKPVSDGMPF
jgi:hypothetical protein